MEKVGDRRPLGRVDIELAQVLADARHELVPDTMLRDAFTFPERILRASDGCMICNSLRVDGGPRRENGDTSGLRLCDRCWRDLINHIDKWRWENETHEDRCGFVWFGITNDRAQIFIRTARLYEEPKVGDWRAGLTILAVESGGKNQARYLRSRFGAGGVEPSSELMEYIGSLNEPDRVRVDIASALGAFLDQSLKEAPV